MAINKLKVTFQLRYDSFDNWTSNNPFLTEGEIAVAYINDIESNMQSTVLIKVGPGDFNNLPWASALAADVYEWAKKSDEEFIIWMNHLLDNAVLNIYTKNEIDEKFNNIQPMSDNDIYEAIGMAGEGTPITPSGQILQEMTAEDVQNIIKH